MVTTGSPEKATISIPIVEDPGRYDRLAELYKGFLAVRERLRSLNVGLDTISSLLEHPETANPHEKPLLDLLKGTLQLINQELQAIRAKVKVL